jgi:hypothetical protein
MRQPTSAVSRVASAGVTNAVNSQVTSDSRGNQKQNVERRLPTERYAGNEVGKTGNGDQSGNGQ